ncbi:MAG: serine hydrolase [Taibaiella sp.]|nr:serine hydrolase [Taibaiella sp.]
MNMRLPLTLLSILLLHINISTASPAAKDREKTSPKKRWVDSVYNSLSVEDRIGQLFMIAAYSGGKNFNEELITKLIDSQHIGGLIFMQGGPVRQAMLTNKYQKRTHVPLLISMDAEWGLGMRLDSVRNFPRQMMLGAARDTGLVYRMGAAIGAQCKRLGVHIDFAPDVDVNNNAANPVINSRSFGEDKHWVAALGKAFMRGLQKAGVIACAKHFPGHGDTNTDSHKDLPLIVKSVEQLDTMELYPFRQLIAAGVKSVMVAHLEVPALDTAAHVPTTLSRNTVTGLLKDKLGFNGLCITDALAMVGVTKYFPAGEADLRAFAAGNDILLFSQDVPAATAKIKNALDSNRLPMIALERSVRKILAAKYDAGLATWQDIDTTNITVDLNKSIDTIRRTAAREAITLVSDDNQILNKLNEKMSVCYIGVNADKTTPVFEVLKDKFPNIKASWLPKGGSADACRNLLAGISAFDAVIVGIHNLNFAPGNNYGMSEEAVNFLQQAGSKTNVMMVLMGNAYATQYFCGSPSIIVSYEDDSLTEVITADVLLKNIKPKGKLPVTACINGKSVCPAPFVMIEKAKEQVKEVPKDLVKTLYPADAGVIDVAALDRLDLFIQRCVADGVFPGCRVLAAKDGKVFFDKAFGNLIYDKQLPVDTNTLYDMASCTKVLATNISIMRLYEEGKLNLDKTLGDYLPLTRGTDKAGLVIKDILLHQAGLKGWIPFYKETLNDKEKPKKTLYRKNRSEEFNIPVAEKLYLRTDYADTLWARILKSPVDNKGKFLYSDLDFILLAAVVQQVTGKPIDVYAEEQFYKPLGLKRILYNPLRRFDTMEIAPTEMDFGFRNQLVHGYVHDPGAAMMGGVAGHAGLFASAHDVAVIFQMLLNKGVYNKTRYFKAPTVELFTAYNSAISHRGLGFDKPATGADDGGPAGARTSGRAFGHQGFTGTCAWGDPATGIVFVFLSNRVYPSAANTKINKENVRTLTQDYIYEALGIPVNHEREQLYKIQTEIK